MKRSTDRILTSHAGNLPRDEALWNMLLARDGGAIDESSFNARAREVVADIVKRQVGVGLDIVNDGEQSKRSWQTYVIDRLSGVEQRPLKPGEEVSGSIIGREILEFPEYYPFGMGGGAPRGGDAPRSGGPAANPMNAVIRAGAAGGIGQPAFAVGPLKYTGQAAIQTEIDNLKAALQGQSYEEAVLTAISPGTVEHWLRNDYYETTEEYLFAVAEALHEEYKAITDAGFMVQIDDPDLADAWQIHPGMSVADYRSFADLRVEAMNHAIGDIPADRVRLHVCWGSIHGPHKHDLHLRDLVDLILKTRAGVYSIEASNPRHDNEWVVWQDARLAAGKVLMPGVVGHASDFIEHPELVAQRLVRYAGCVGRENVIAGTDCGLGGRVGHPSIVWAKFEAMSQGARLATQELWGK